MKIKPSPFGTAFEKARENRSMRELLARKKARINATETEKQLLAEALLFATNKEEFQFYALDHPNEPVCNEQRFPYGRGYGDTVAEVWRDGQRRTICVRWSRMLRPRP